jgi:hypothetical protein
MNPNPTDPKHPWSRLTAAARLAPQTGETGAPYGFATRVAALALAQERVAPSLLERFSLRALGVACLLAVVSAATNYSAIANALAEQEGIVNDDPVAELVDLAS